MQMIQPIMITMMRLITVTTVVLQELLPTKTLNYLGHMLQVIHHEEEVMLGKFIFYPVLTVSVTVEDLNRNNANALEFWNANFICLASTLTKKVTDV